MPRKKPDPRLAALLEKRHKLQAACEKHYGRMKCAFNRLEKTRRQLARVSKRIDDLSRLDERLGSLDAQHAS